MTRQRGVERRTPERKVVKAIKDRPPELLVTLRQFAAALYLSEIINGFEKVKIISRWL